MTAVGELVLVLGLLVSAHCEVRARDPEVEEEEEVVGGRAGGERGAFPSPNLTRQHSGTIETQPLGERPRMGNWCPFVQERLIKMTVVCGTEKYIIKSHLCPSGTPDCQLIMYKIATRPVYTQKEKIVTSLVWACCEGHSGPSCEDTVPDSQLDSGSSDLSGGSAPESQEVRAPDVQVWQQQQGDPNLEQNDFHSPVTSPLYNTSNPTNQYKGTEPTHTPDHAPSHHHTSQHHHDHQHRHHPVEEEVNSSADVLSYPEATSALPVPHMMALVMSQLQPVLQGFNRSLEQLSRQVGDLAHDVAQLKSNQRGPEQQPEPLDGPELDEAAEGRVKAKLEEVSEQIRLVQSQMESQRTDMENRLHSQHAMLHYNLTSFKLDVDMKLKRHQKMLQVSLQAMNETLSELKLDESTEDLLENHSPAPPPSLPPPHQPQPSDTSALWEAIERLDNMVVNNTVKVSGLVEDMEVTSGGIQLLRKNLDELKEQVDQSSRNARILFMETGLEVDAAKAAVTLRVDQLAENLTLQSKRLQEMEEDMDNMYIAFNKNNLPGDCTCNTLKTAMAQLERAVANVTELANENRLALDETSEEEAEQWSRTGDWLPAVEELQQGLQQVKESLSVDRSRTRTLELSLTQLNSSVAVTLAEVSGLKETDTKLSEQMQHLHGAFQSLLKDAIRHSDILELLLGEEVLEFLEWSEQDQEAHSIPALKLQLAEHNQKIKSLEHRAGGREEEPSADQPSSSHLPDGMTLSGGGVPARERQLLLHPEHRGDGGDLWNLEKTVEELGLKVLRLEKTSCPCANVSTEREASSAGVDVKLRSEVLWLKRGLEDHLSVFKNVFSNADVLAASDATLELDKLWKLVKDTDGKKEKKRGRGENRRNSRDSSGVAPAPAGLSGDSVLFVAGSPLSVSNSGVAFKASLNRGQFRPDAGTFTAHVDGIYLFILTLDLRPGQVNVVLKKGSGGAQVSLHQQKVVKPGLVTGVGLLLLREGEEVRLELRRGAWRETEDNVFSGLLLHRTN